MFLAPLNYDRFFRKVFSHVHIAKAFLEDFLDVTIEEIEPLEKTHFLTSESSKLEFDFRCKINGADIIVDMQQWYKPDVVKRFYLYHCTSTALQLERLPEKKLPTISPDKRAKTPDYRIVSPVITLIWMVNDNLRFKENFISYIISPEKAVDFIQDEALWQNNEIKTLLNQRNELLKILQKKDKELDFLPQNRLIFMFQSNIIKDTKLSKYFKWFDFAAKTLDKENEEEDFSVYEKDNIFKEIMFLINKKGLDKSDFEYIESEEEHIIMINRTLEGEFIKGKAEGKVEGKAEGKAESVILLYKKGKTLEDISEWLEISLNEVNLIINEAKQIGKL